MGESRRRREARIDRTARGLPVPRPDRCPGCGSKRITHAMMPKGCEYGACLDCRAIWEAFPSMMVEDPVCAEPCGNCAFRPGSPEQRDPEKWKALIASLDPKETDYGMWFGGKFYCHKGVPIDIEKGAGNFIFPTRPLAPDFAPGATTYDTSRMRTCTGFLRMFWAKSKKREADPRRDDAPMPCHAGDAGADATIGGTP